MNAHTPTPWHAVISRSGLPYVVDDHNGVNQLTIVESPKSHQDHETDAANCMHICRAVNSHDALLAACQSLRDELVRVTLAPASDQVQQHVDADTLESLRVARIAIAQATGNESVKE